MPTETITVDLEQPAHGRALLELLNEYARHPMGGGRPLPAFTRAKLVNTLRARPDFHGVLARVDGRPAGLILAFEGFSTFACQPLLNLHDVVVTEAQRGKGLAQAMLAHAESLAKELGCCKLTLEVLDGNGPARRAYDRFGFAPYELDPDQGKALFWEKKIKVR